MRYEIRLAGEGGQGLILGGIILAEAAGIYDGKEVVQTQIYGAAARGELSKSEVVISDGPVWYPKVEAADLLLALTQSAYDEYIEEVKETGIVIVDSFYVRNYRKGDKVYSLALSEVARRIVGREIATNIVSLGVITAISGVVSRDAMREAVLHKVPKGTQEKNSAALEEGFRMGEDAVKIH